MFVRKTDIAGFEFENLGVDDTREPVARSLLEQPLGQHQKIENCAGMLFSLSNSSSDVTFSTWVFGICKNLSSIIIFY